MSNHYLDNHIAILKRPWNNNHFATLLSIVFFVISFIGLLNHEMWRDELQAWLIARDSSSIINLFENLRYEGHPGLWHLGLYVITRFTSNPLWMQIYHLILATAIVYTFSRFSPFTNFQKIIFSFGYFPFYEYSIISRNYGIGILLLFAFCISFTKPSRRYIIFSIILALMANTNIYGTMLAISIGATLLLEILLNGNLSNILSHEKREIGVSIFIFFMGVGAAILQVLPPPDRARGLDWRTNLDMERLLRTVNIIVEAYLPKFFNYISLSRDNIFVFLISLLLIIISITLILNNKKALFLYLFGTGLILLFSYTKYSGFTRHHGNLFMLLIACLWISYQPRDKTKILVTRNKTINQFINLVRQRKKSLITLILGIHLVVGVPYFAKDLIYPFSASSAAANYIAKDHKLNNLIIVGYPIQQLAPIAGLLNKKIYYPQQKSLGSFTVWTKDNVKEMTTQEILKHIRKLNQQYNQSLLLITNYPLENDEILAIQPSLSVSEEARFTQSMREKYYLYLVKR